MPKKKTDLNPREEGVSNSTCNISPLHVLSTLKMIGASPSKVASVKTKSDMCQHISRALGLNCLRDWKFKAFLGSGVYGSIFSVRSKSGAVRAAKIVSVNPAPEVRAQRKMADIGIAPKLYDSCKLSGNVWVIIMEKIDGTLQDLVGGAKGLSRRRLDSIFREVVILVEKMEEARVCHGDLSLDNVGYVTRPDGRLRLVLIDFGWSGHHVPMFDMTSLAQSLLFTKNEVNRNYLYDKTHQYLVKKHNFRIPGSTDGFDAFFKDMQKAYVTNVKRL